MRRIALAFCWLICLLGCSHGAHLANWKNKLAIVRLADPPSETNATDAMLSNPLYVPPVDREVLWNQIVDTVDDYFHISRERRVRDIGGVLTDGQIDTFPTIGSTVLEPWRKDSTHGYQRLYASLQSVRRQAFITVAPDHKGYFVQVVVNIELEAVDHPEYSSVGSSTMRHDNSLVSRPGKINGQAARERTIGWIPKGRDTSLEQLILQEIRTHVASLP